jgi:hypothetical protein
LNVTPPSRISKSHKKIEVKLVKLEIFKKISKKIKLEYFKKKSCFSNTLGAEAALHHVVPALSAASFQTAYVQFLF